MKISVHGRGLNSIERENFTHECLRGKYTVSCALHPIIVRFLPVPGQADSFDFLQYFLSGTLTRARQGGGQILPSPHVFRRYLKTYWSILTSFSVPDQQGRIQVGAAGAGGPSPMEIGAPAPKTQGCPFSPPFDEYLARGRFLHKRCYMGAFLPAKAPF